jgi:nicotinate-nucleotide adenylyltransferase
VTTPRRKNEPRRWGILGGSFDPVHNGHIHLARGALDELGLDRIVFIPAATPPHKITRRLAPARDRLAMLRLAAGGENRIAVDEMEITRGGVSYTWQTMERLSEAHPDILFHFLIGSDSLGELETWRRISQIARMVTFAVLGRGGAPVTSLRETLLAALRGVPLKTVSINAGSIDVSSTEIRRRVTSGEPVDSLVPPGVAAYIADHGLYR